MKQINKWKIATIFLGIILVILVLPIFSIFYSNYKDLIKEHDSLKSHLNKILSSYEEDKKNFEQEIKDINIQFEQKINSMSAIDYKPTFKEVKEVLRNYNDNTRYDDEDYNCVDYSQTLVKKFKENKIYSCMVNIYFKEGAHANVAVETSDKGVIYIEPQDKIILYELNIGEDYCDKMNWYCEKGEWEIEYFKSCFN
jgi:hypothetical protein